MDGNLTISAFGDLDGDTGSVTVESEGLSFGILLVSDTANGPLSSVADDIGDEEDAFRSGTSIGTATVEADLAPRIADGGLRVTFAPSAPVINGFTSSDDAEKFIPADIPSTRPG